MGINTQYEKYLNYIYNAVEVKKDVFCDDWEPIGQRLIVQMVNRGFIKIDAEEYLILTTKGFEAGGIPLG